MLTLNELVIHDLSGDLTTLPQRVEAVLSNGWQRDHALEQRLAMKGHVCCFKCSDVPGRPAAAVWLQPRSADEWRVANVVPLGTREVTDDEYDAILKDFESTLQARAGAAATLKVEITTAEDRLEEGLSAEARRRLNEFSATANRSSLHENDRSRWQAFVIQAHRDDALFDGRSLDGWLAANCWLEPQRRELVRDYDLGRALLEHYDEQRGA
ncbi:MAG TPA: hypothetical protein VJ783_10915 [Pirellulales bacterium]|nr:hypothetical protein [Pirellulales bacterium]